MCVCELCGEWHAVNDMRPRPTYNNLSSRCHAASFREKSTCGIEDAQGVLAMVVLDGRETVPLSPTHQLTMQTIQTQAHAISRSLSSSLFMCALRSHNLLLLTIKVFAQCAVEFRRAGGCAGVLATGIGNRVIHTSNIDTDSFAWDIVAAAVGISVDHFCDSQNTNIAPSRRRPPFAA